MVVLKIAIVVLLMVLGALGASVGGLILRDLVIGKGRVLGPAVEAAVVFNGNVQPNARTFFVRTHGAVRQIVVYVPESGTPAQVYTIELQGRDFGRTVSGRTEDHRLLAGRILVQSEMGKRWKPLSFFGPVSVTVKGTQIRAEVFGDGHPVSLEIDVKAPFQMSPLPGTPEASDVSTGQGRFDVFRHLPESLTRDDIVKRLGPPLRDIGSGLYIWEYELGKGRSGVVSHNGQKIMSLTYVDASGSHVVVLDPTRPIPFHWQTWYDFPEVTLFCRGPERRDAGKPMGTLTDYVFEVSEPRQRLVMTSSSRDWDSEDRTSVFKANGKTFVLKLLRLPAAQEPGALTLETSAEGAR